MARRPAGDGTRALPRHAPSGTGVRRRRPEREPYRRRGDDGRGRLRRLSLERPHLLPAPDPYPRPPARPRHERLPAGGRRRCGLWRLDRRPARPRFRARRALLVRRNGDDRRSPCLRSVREQQDGGRGQGRCVTTGGGPLRGSSGDFWKFWAGQTISNFGSSFTLFALPLLVFKLTGSALSLGLVTAVEFLPYLLFGLFLGAWADRVDRKRMMILSDVARAGLIASIPALALFGGLAVWWIYAVGFLSSALKICFDAGEFAAVPSLVGKDDLVRANGRIQASYYAASVAGPLVAGAAVALAPVEAVLLLDALSFLASALALALVRRSFNATSDGEERGVSSILEDVREGLRYVLSNPVLRNIAIMMATVNFVGATTIAQLTFFAKERLDATDAGVGVLYSAGGVGIVLLSLAAGPIRGRVSFSKAALGALMLHGLLTFAFALSDRLWIAVPLWALASGFALFFNINTTSIRQAMVPNRMLGRVQTVAVVLAWSAIPLGSTLGGLAIEWTANVALVYGLIGVFVFLIALVFSFTALGKAEWYLPSQQTHVEKLAAEPSP
ncbi:MAG: hypothetical protein CYG60_06700 [Actinobacteria bacterium]|nr:MAG: hypothetical protein CYG60_06700 [Actinomycetota bacterium]